MSFKNNFLFSFSFHKKVILESQQTHTSLLLALSPRAILTQEADPREKQTVDFFPRYFFLEIMKRSRSVTKRMKIM